LLSFSVSWHYAVTQFYLVKTFLSVFSKLLTALFTHQQPGATMKTLIAIALLTSSTAFAQCQTYGNTTNCQNGTTYQQYGNTTQGYNSNTGNSWTQTQIGNSTYGQDSQGRTWNQTQQGNNTYGTDAKGRSYFCTKVGNQTICN
jgi:hypothetical protein